MESLTKGEQSRKEVRLVIFFLALILLIPSSLSCSVPVSPRGSSIEVRSNVDASLQGPNNHNCASLIPCNETSCPALMPGASESLCSYNWSGYVVVGEPDTVSAVNGSWVVAQGGCSSTVTTSVAEWVGIDGYNSSTIEQTGTASICLNGEVSYFAFYEFNLNESVTISSVKVSAGDQINAGVSYDNRTNLFTSWIRSSGGGSNTSSEEVVSASRNSAEWIVERPEICNGQRCVLSQLADFGQASFDSSEPSRTRVEYATVGDSTLSLKSLHINALTIIDGRRGTILAEPSPISEDGGFSVAYGGTFVSVTCNLLTPPVGSAVTCVADVTGTYFAPTGGIVWTTDGQGRFSRRSCWVIGNSCTVKYIPTSSSPSRIAITANYSADMYNNPSFADTDLIVKPSSSSTVVTCSRFPSALQDKVFRCVAKIRGYVPTGIVVWSQSGVGSVTFSSSSCPLLSKSCSVIVTRTGAGRVSIVGRYVGNVNNLPSQGTANLG